MPDPVLPRPAPGNGFCADHARLLCDSFRRWTGRTLITPMADPVATAQRLFEAPFAVLSHGGGPDPLFTYANRTALLLFNVSWDGLVSLPSRLPAEPVEQAERARLLQRVTEHGFIDDYSGVRISRTGRRFRIRRAVVWTLIDGAGDYVGQAATFGDWEPVS